MLCPKYVIGITYIRGERKSLKITVNGHLSAVWHLNLGRFMANVDLASVNAIRLGIHAIFGYWLLNQARLSWCYYIFPSICTTGTMG